MKQEPITDIREVQDFVRFLREIGEASLKTKNLPEREALQWGMQRLGPCAMSLIGIIERSGIPKDMQKAAQLDLLRALAAAFEIGSHGTVSENTAGYVKAVVTAPGRSKAAEKREPSDKLMQETIAKYEQLFPPGRRGLAKRVAKDLGVHPRTVSRHRKKMRTP
jgi:hypothetical protein